MTPSRGETNLARLLAGLDPLLAPEEFAFVTTQLDLRELATWSPWALIREVEGWTVILPVDVALARGLPAGPALRRLTLRVHSSLEAVGLTAAVSAVLAEAGIGANVVAAYHHDHVFVPAALAERALEALVRAFSGAEA